MSSLTLNEVDNIEITTIITDELDPISPSPNPAVHHPSHFMGIPLSGVENVSERGGAKSEMRMGSICCGAHGLSLLITVTQGERKKTILFDAGPEASLWKRNCDLVGHGIGNVECIVLSHYHRDHSGGLLQAIETIRERKSSDSKIITVDLHPDRPAYRGVQSPYGPISLEADPSFADIESLDAQVALSSAPHTIMDGAFLVSGEIPRRTSYEKGFPGGLQFYPSSSSGGEWKADELLMDERYVACHLKGKGLVVFTGCGHAGVINTCIDAQKLCPGVPIYCVAGGFHLSDASPDKIAQTVDDMVRLKPGILLGSHCTGWRFKQEIEKVLPGVVVPGTVGMTYTFVD